jgi:hypothetical protein
MNLLVLVATYCKSRNLDFRQYLIGLFGGLTEDNTPSNFIEKQYAYHLDWIKKV